MKCRHCAAPLQHTFLDLGYAPPSNAYRSVADRSAPELTFPLRVMVCERCWLVQTEDYSRADELFTEDYAYFSSASRSWLEHARRYSQAVTARFGLGPASHVIEVASNDGYLLRNFVATGVPCLGVEPTASTAQAAESLGIPVRREFFGEAMATELVREGLAADLIIGNNVYAHVPDINDFTRALRTALKPQGVVTLEFPHVMRLIEFAQFDTVYHEHYSYHSLYTVSQIFAAAGLRVWDVEELPTHGGSLRVYGCHAADPRETTPAVAALLAEEAARGLQRLDAYIGFQGRADRIKDDVLRFLLDVKQRGASVAGYGAAAKGNTLLNYAGVRGNLLPYVVDAAVAKQGKLLPGSHIPIHAPDVLVDRQPDYVFILPWNLKDEVRAQLAPLAARGTKFVTAVPNLEIA